MTGPWLGGAVYAIDPAFWLIAAFVLAVVATNLAWLPYRRLVRPMNEGPARAGLAAAGWSAVACFFLLPPFGAWMAGALSPYWLGLAEVDWVPNLGRGLPAAAGLTGLLLVCWLAYRHGLPRDPRRAWPVRLAGVLRAVLDAALLQWHWAFCRALMIELAAERLPGLIAIAGADRSVPARLAGGLQGDPQYWGAWLALGLVAVMWLINPFAREELRGMAPGRRADAALRRAALAVGTTALFILTRNFWLCLASHVAVEAAIAAWFPSPQPAAPGAATKTNPASG